jgi:LysR family transcriptional regulator, hydrogen peroxide-inducible genes activator
VITLRQLRYFEALARTRHFGQAARQCAVTQPALSMQIRELERELGAELVERGVGSVSLTPTGQEIARRAEEILMQVRELAEQARLRRGPLIGPFRLGLIPSVAPYLLPRLLSLAEENYPSLDLQIRETQTATLLEELTRGDLDAAVLALPVGQAGIESERLIEDRFLIAVEARAEENWTNCTDLRLRIQEERLLLLEEGHCLREQALHYCQLAHVQARQALAATSLTTIIQMVAAGRGITLLPEICAEAEVDQRRVALIPFPDDAPSRTIGLAWRHTSVRRPDCRALAALIRQSWPARTNDVRQDESGQAQSEKHGGLR